MYYSSPLCTVPFSLLRNVFAFTLVDSFPSLVPQASPCSCFRSHFFTDKKLRGETWVRAIHSLPRRYFSTVIHDTISEVDNLEDSLRDSTTSDKSKPPPGVVCKNLHDNVPANAPVHHLGNNVLQNVGITMATVANLKYI